MNSKIFRIPKANTLRALALAGAAACSMAFSQSNEQISNALPLADTHFHLMKFMTPEDLKARMEKHNIRWTISAGAIGGPEVGEPWMRDTAVQKLLGHGYIPGSGGREIYVAEKLEGMRFFNEPENAHRLQVLQTIEKQTRTTKAVIVETFPNAENSSVDPMRRRRVAVDGPFFQELMRIAVAAQVPLPMHMEWHPESVAQLKALLTQHPQGTVMLSHCGKTTVAQDIRELFLQHSNVFCDLGFRGNPQTQAESQRDPRRLIYWPSSLFRSAGIKQDWLLLIEEFPERFTVAIDDVHNWSEYDEVVQAIRTGLLAKLSPGTAEKVAWKNAVRIFRLNP